MADAVTAKPAAPAAPSGSSSAAAAAESRAREEAKRRRAAPGANASAEERAKYELERKKVAKYKEDKLKARRDHTRMILESHAQAKRRALLGKQSEFLANLEFRNALPDLPFDTKFLKYPHESERAIKYKPNTLEQDYVYEIHEDANLGLDIDLIDPAKYEAPAHPGPLEIGDEQALMMKEESAKSAKSKIRPSVSWLRRTEYLGTDLYDAVHKFKSEVEIQSALREGTENALAEVVQISLEDRAEASFRDINNPKTLVHPFKKNLKIAKVWDVFPDQVLAANKYTILSYDVLPSSDVKSKTILDRESRALLCGVSKKSHGENIQGSILLPNASNEEEKEQDENLREKFSYFREYQLAIETLGAKAKEDAQHCVFMFDPEANQFTYSDISHRIQLKKTKLNGEDKRHRGAVVHRREYSEAESERRQSVMFEYGGLYDESLDDEELVREYKRQRSSKQSSSSGDKATLPPPAAASPRAEETHEEEEKEAPPSPPATKEGGDGNGSPEASSDSDSE